MDLLVVPPLTDFTTEVVPPAGMLLLDLNERLVERLADPARLRAAAERLGDGPLTALSGRAAAVVLERKAFDHAHLRAVGTALELAGDPAVRLAADGLELTEGCPQSSRDVLRAARRCELFHPEIHLAKEAAKLRRAHVLVDDGDQLPAAFALVDALGAARVTLCGRFVADHVAALRRVPELAAVQWASWTPERVIRPLWYVGGEPGERVRWLTGTRPPPESGPWAGWLDAARVAALPREALARCRGLTITVTRIDFLGAATGLDGMTVNLRRLMSAIPPGVPVACELAVGAPGVTAGVVEESAELLADGAGGVRLGGLRPYRMGIRSSWAGQSVRFPPAAGHDLVRWMEFDAPDTMRPSEVAILIRRLLERLHGLLPGRLAACTVAGDSPDRHALIEPAGVLAG
ncbi:hypothetical protein [Nonomuraea basaltis]|uniref:hypothetical protein n=1 Tax=Nonomuraea basaltis TaxID=2495887 RepID=UPI00110C61C1|nr:hypothetical protein [Nonomuraea basaltis]TMR94351.1 hypothetical protein EJK15_34335 [Nonomuraea basaltis]